MSNINNNRSSNSSNSLPTNREDHINELLYQHLAEKRNPCEVSILKEAYLKEATEDFQGT